MDPLVTTPCWDWVNDRAIPTQLSVASDLDEWGITRGSFNSAFLPSASVINGVMASADFTSFTAALEGPHGWVHGAVGGTMGTSTSPADPLFWLHRGFIDKLWADWQVAHPAPGGNPMNMSETLQPAPIMTRTVAQYRAPGRSGTSMHDGRAVARPTFRFASGARPRRDAAQPRARRSSSALDYATAFVNVRSTPASDRAAADRSAAGRRIGLIAMPAECDRFPATPITGAAGLSSVVRR